MNAAETTKHCCAKLYESDFAKFLIGDSLHPGGTKLTERLGVLLDLKPGSRVLDAASGRGTSAVFLAERFGCHAVGIDYSSQNVAEANARAASKAFGTLASFEQADAERLPFADSSFDAIICECAYCTFPDKQAAAREFARVLRPGGRIGLSDLTRGPVLPNELQGLLAWISCIADAQPIDQYVAYLSDAGLRPQCIEQHDDALLQLVRHVRTRLLGAEVLVALKRLDLPCADLGEAKALAKAALSAVQDGTLGYAIIVAAKQAIER